VASFDRAIPPGGVGTITLMVDTRGYNGSIVKGALVRTNDPAQQAVNITVRANVLPYIVVEPGEAILLSGIAGDDVRQTVRIRPGDDFPLEIQQVNADELGSQIDYKLTQGKEKHSYELIVNVKGGEPRRLSGRLFLVTNHPEKRDLILPVRIDLRTELETSPNVVAFGPVSPAKMNPSHPVRILHVINHRGRGFVIRNLQYNEDYFEVRSIPLTSEPAPRYQIEVRPRLDRLPAGLSSDTLVIVTDARPNEPFRIPMSITVQK
jgi:hypothetical protein